MIAVVGSRTDSFPFMAGATYGCKTVVYHEDDAYSFYYNELCGCRFLLDNRALLAGGDLAGLEHYRRAFLLTEAQKRVILEEYDVIVKNQHGPYGNLTNLTCLHGCSRYGIDYFEQASRWVEKWPELAEQANGSLHYGCNMFICKPTKFVEMMEHEFAYIDEMLHERRLSRAVISYFAETILTPYIIDTHCNKIYTATVVTPC